MCGDDNSHKPMRLIKRRVVINSADRDGRNDTTTDYVIVLPAALQNIVFCDWVYSSNTYFLLSIDELTKTGFTSGNSQYWRYMSETVNNRYSKTQEAFEEPRSFNKLTFRWRNADGSIPQSMDENTTELEFWEKTGDIDDDVPCSCGKKKL